MRADTGGEVVPLSDYLGPRDGVTPPLSHDHIDLDGLLARGVGSIDGAAGAAMRAHCRACAPCGDQLAIFLLLMEVKQRRAQRRRRVVGALAATVVFSVALTAAFASGALSVFGAGTDRVDARRLATAEGPNRVDLDFIYPNQIPTSQTAASDKRASLALIVAGRYRDAAELLTALYAAHPGDAEAAALLGMALYLAGDDGDRVGGLLRRGAEELRRQDLQHYARWFLANHHLRRGDVVKTSRILDELSQWPDSPGGKAIELLERLGAEAR